MTINLISSLSWCFSELPLSSTVNSFLTLTRPSLCPISNLDQLILLSKLKTLKQKAKINSISYTLRTPRFAKHSNPAKHVLPSKDNKKLHQQCQLTRTELSRVILPLSLYRPLSLARATAHEENKKQTEQNSHWRNTKEFEQFQRKALSKNRSNNRERNADQKPFLQDCIYVYTI